MGRRWLLGLAVAVILVCGGGFWWAETVAIAARAAAKPVMKALMKGEPVPAGWSSSPRLEEMIREMRAETGPATEAYIVRPSGYAGNHHISWIGLSRRGGIWHREQAVFNEGRRSVSTYNFGKLEVGEEVEILKEVDRLAREAGVERKDLNVIDRSD